MLSNKDRVGKVYLDDGRKVNFFYLQKAENRLEWLRNVFSSCKFNIKKGKKL